MAHKYVAPFLEADFIANRCARCKLPPKHVVHVGNKAFDEWEVKFLPWGDKKPWFSYHPDKKLIHHATWADGMARVCEELREKQG